MTDLAIQQSHPEIQTKESRILLALSHSLSTAWLILKDFRNGLTGAGLPIGKAFEMLYVEPCQASRHQSPAVTGVGEDGRDPSW